MKNIVGFYFMKEQLQIDFLPVDSGEKSGDAIAFRYGDFTHRSTFKVVVIDGGTKDSGNRLVEHIQQYFHTNEVDLVICTHPDADHASGLRQVMNQCVVKELWIHKPWDHSEAIRDLFQDGRITGNSLSERLKLAYNYAHELVELAEEKGIDVREPFAGRKTEDGKVNVLGPTVDYYRELIPEFSRSPQQKTTVLENLTRTFNKAINWIQETLHIETLDDSGITSAVNLSSAVILLEFNNKKYLFTGDAGIQSLEKVLEYTKNNYIDISNIEFFQVPHHGSKRNISPAILNAIKCKTAYVSASKDAPKHPAKKVTNALIRRGANVYKTGGQVISHHNNAPRDGWTSLTPIQFFDQVEE